MVLLPLPVGMIGCITCSHKVVSIWWRSYRPKPGRHCPMSLVLPWYTHAYIQGYTVIQNYTTNSYIIIYIYLVLHVRSSTPTVVCLWGDIMLRCYILVHQYVAFACLCTLRIRSVKLNRSVLQWPSQEFYFGAAWSFKNRQGKGDRDQWMDWELCLLTCTCNDLLVKCSLKQKASTGMP